MNLAWELIVGWLCISSLAGFFLMGIDKVRAQDRSRRIRESVFFRLAAIGGVFGILLGSGFFHHKTLKGSFIGIILFIAVVWVFILLALQGLFGTPFT